MNTVRFAVALFSMSAFLVFAPQARGQDTGAAAAEAPAAQPLQRQFREISLGMGLEDLQTALQDDPLFNFRGERDVSFIPTRQESLVETAGFSFVRRAFFQLRDGQLFIISLTLNPDLMDFHSMFTTLVQRYGQPFITVPDDGENGGRTSGFLGPREMVWDDGNTRISLERPLTVRYIDRAVFDDILNESATVDSQRVQQQQEFLDAF